MIIDLSSLLDNSKELLKFEGDLSLDSVDVSNRDINIVSPVKYQADIYKIDGELTIYLEISYDYEEDCHRCLGPSTSTVKSKLTGKLVKGRKKDNEDADQGYEETFYFEDDRIEIDGHIINQVILSLPMKSLCETDCKGLCPLCGTDLNKEKCDCIIDNIDPRLEKLKNFFPKS